MAPPVWHQLIKSPDPEDFYYHLDTEGKHDIERWRLKRGGMLQSRIQQEVQAKIEDEETLVRDSTPFVRVLVRSFDRGLLDATKDNNDEAVLTVWSPTEEQLSLLREGSVLRVENLAAPRRYEGRFQFSANARTRMDLWPTTPRLQDLLLSSGYIERQYTSLFQIHLSSRELLQPNISGRYSDDLALACDFVGIILKVVENEAGHPLVVYVTDRSNLILRVCGGVKGLGDAIGLRSSVARECVEHPRVIVFRDLTVLPFDKVENCAVAEFRAVSSVRTQLVEPTAESLKQYVESHQVNRAFSALLQPSMLVSHFGRDPMQLLYQLWDTLLDSQCNHRISFEFSSIAQQRKLGNGHFRFI